MKKTLIAIISLIAAVPLAASAAPFAVHPKAGQWVVKTETVAEGKNVGPQLDLIKQQAGAFLKPKDLEKLNSYDPRQFQECLTSDQAAVLADPQESMRFLNKSLKECQLKMDAQTKSGLDFSGYCKAPKQGIDGNVKGHLNYDSPTHVTGYLEGKGTLPPPIQLILIGRVQPQIHLRNDFSAQWQQTQCTAR